MHQQLAVRRAARLRSKGEGGRQLGTEGSAEGRVGCSPLCCVGSAAGTTHDAGTTTATDAGARAAVRTGGQIDEGVHELLELGQPPALCGDGLAERAVRFLQLREARGRCGRLDAPLLLLIRVVAQCARAEGTPQPLNGDDGRHAAALLGASAAIGAAAAHADSEQGALARQLSEQPRLRHAVRGHGSHRENVAHVRPHDRRPVPRARLVSDQEPRGRAAQRGAVEPRAAGLAVLLSELHRRRREWVASHVEARQGA